MTAHPAVAAPAPQNAHGVAQWRSTLLQERLRLKQRFVDGGSPTRLLQSLSTLTDRLLRAAWKAAGMPRKLALVAVGGYGRGELYPYSDVDLLVLLPASPDTVLQARLEQLIGMLWDMGLEVGHSVRTVEECVSVAAQDITVQTTLLESRLITGSRDLFDTFSRRYIEALSPVAFLEAKQLEQQQRHARHQESNLEPNIKESPGGLRDLQNVLWIARSSSNGRSWSELAEKGLITADEAGEIRRNERFLQALRTRLHYLAGRREDRLLFDHQSALAREFGLKDKPARLASEQLMQRYYRAAKSVNQLNVILLQNLGSRVLPVKDGAARALNLRFSVRDERLETTDEGVYEREPGAIIETFALLQQHHELRGIGAGTLRALWRARHHVGPAWRQATENRDMFLALLRSPSRVFRELRRMNQYGILGRYIPAFGRIVGQMQHDLYHVYTVDEHILKVVRNLRRFAVPELAHEFPLCSRLMNRFERPELLYLAGLFHDIAKGRGGDHSHLGRTDALRFCRAHKLAAEDGDLVAWLVENHLVMSATAQKRDLSDPDVLQAFAARVVTERRLIALYLLTVADIRGTSPKVWNAWKGKLLEDLFHLTRRLLRGEKTSLEGDLQARQEEALAKLRLYAVPGHAHEKLWARLDTSYFLRHDPQEIAWHARMLCLRVDTEKPVVKARLSPAGEGLQVLVYTPDQPELFARICAFFDGISYDIHEAKICTTRHGYALDSFQVQDPDNRNPQYRDLISYVEYELPLQLQRRDLLPPPAKPRLNRQLRHFPISPQIDIQSDEKGAYKVLSIIAGDRPGLLSGIARILAAHDISVHTARINTLGIRAEDIFLITGAALADSKAVLKLESSLAEQLKT